MIDWITIDFIEKYCADGDSGTEQVLCFMFLILYEGVNGFDTKLGDSRFYQ